MPPHITKKKTRLRSLFFRVFYLKKRKSRFSLQIKKRRFPFASLTETEKKGVLRTQIYNGAPPHTPHSPLGRSGVYSTQKTSVALRYVKGKRCASHP